MSITSKSATVPVNTDKQAGWLIATALVVSVLVFAVAGANSSDHNSLGLDVRRTTDGDGSSTLTFTNTQATPVRIKAFSVNDRPECTDNWLTVDANKLALMFHPSLGLGDTVSLVAMCKVFKAHIVTDRGDLDLTFK